MTQDTALQILKTGANVFVTGEPGAGKTHVINQYISWCEAAGLSVAVTASTGIAATHIGGMTIHAWSGVGARDTLTARDIDAIASREKVVKRIKRTHILVIDEISMLSGPLLDGIDAVCKAVRGNGEPFGGLQVVFVGDFFQLPPITRGGMDVAYAFEASAWRGAHPLVCYLMEQHRQEDELYLGLLAAIRRNDVEESHYTLLSEQTEIGYDHIEPTRLHTHNADVDAINATALKALPGTARTFSMSARGTRQHIEALMRTCLSPETLQLKEESMVMCTKNNFEKGYVNGTLGRVVSFSNDGDPVIETASGETLTITPQSWSIAEEGKVLAEVTQVPLRLAWAITIHKSQGMSLDAAEIDLSRAFAYGQGYVALSRVRTLAGLKLLGIGPNALVVDPRVVSSDEQFQSESAAAERTFRAMEEAALTQMHHDFVAANGGRLPKAGEVGQARPAARVKSESTTAETHTLLAEQKSVHHIAKERSLTESTIWNHLETLTSEKKIGVHDITHLLPSEWDTVWPQLHAAFEEVGDEKLKPVFEYCDEAFEYPLIRLGRIMYQLSKYETTS